MRQMKLLLYCCFSLMKQNSDWISTVARGCVRVRAYGDSRIPACSTKYYILLKELADKPLKLRANTVNYLGFLKR